MGVPHGQVHPGVSHLKEFQVETDIWDLSASGSTSHHELGFNEYAWSDGRISHGQSGGEEIKKTPVSLNIAKVNGLSSGSP